MTLTEAKNLADRLNTGKSSVYTVADRHEAIRLLERTNKGSKTQKAWDRLDARLRALKASVPA